MQTIEQQRAKHALSVVESWKNSNQGDQKELKSYVVAMPAMMLMSGFGQTCAFYQSKGNNHAKVLASLAQWLGKKNLIANITHCTAQEYQLLQAESLAYLNWLKQFARAYLADEETEVDHATTA